MPAAVKLLTRAASLHPEESRRLELLPSPAFALMETGEFERLMEVVGETKQAAMRPETAG